MRSQLQPWAVMVEAARSGQASKPLAAGLISGILAAVLQTDNTISRSVLERVPEDFAFIGAFLTFTSLVLGLRSSHALQRFFEAAGLLHKLSACWFHAASTLFALSRSSPAEAGDVLRFRETLLRLVSKLNALCLEDLENKETDTSKKGHSFEVLGFEDLREDIQDHAVTSSCKVEYVFHLIQMLMVDMVDAKVLLIAPPILSRTFQEFSLGMMTYHEAKKIAHVSIPAAYHLMNFVIIVSIFMVIPIAAAAKAPNVVFAFVGAFTFTFLSTLLHSTANQLLNPFAKEGDLTALLTADVQKGLNEQLMQIVKMCDDRTPSLSDSWVGTKSVQGTVSRKSLGSVRLELGTVLDDELLQLELAGAYARKNPVEEDQSSSHGAASLCCRWRRGARGARNRGKLGSTELPDSQRTSASSHGCGGIVDSGSLGVASAQSSTVHAEPLPAQDEVSWGGSEGTLSSDRQCRSAQAECHERDGRTACMADTAEDTTWESRLPIAVTGDVTAS